MKIAQALPVLCDVLGIVKNQAMVGKTTVLYCFSDLPNTHFR